MNCEWCREIEVTEGRSEKPTEDDYFTYVTEDPESDEGLGIKKKHFCSVRCLDNFLKAAEVAQ